MKEIVKSKVMIGFVMFILGFAYITTPVTTNNNEILNSDNVKTTYNI